MTLDEKQIRRERAQLNTKSLFFRNDGFKLLQLRISKSEINKRKINGTFKLLVKLLNVLWVYLTVMEKCVGCNKIGKALSNFNLYFLEPKTSSYKIKTKETVKK